MIRKNNSNIARSFVAHFTLIILSFMCLFFFYILIVNSTCSHAELQKGFSALPKSNALVNFRNVANDGTFPMLKGIVNSIIVSSLCAAICTYFSALTAFGLYVYDFKLKKVALMGSSSIIFSIKIQENHTLPLVFDGIGR